MSKVEEGFTLIEMSVVLVIVGLLLSMLMSIMNGAYSLTKRKQVQQDLMDVQQALLGYASIHGVLPCPDLNEDGIDDSCSNSNSTASTEGNLPWSSIGFKKNDPWGRPYRYRVNNALSVPFQLSTSGSGAGQIKICMDASCSRTEASNVALVVYSRAMHDANQPPKLLDEAENADQDNIYVSHVATADGFDDEIIWLSYPLLMNRMVILDRLR